MLLAVLPPCPSVVANVGAMSQGVVSRGSMLDALSLEGPQNKRLTRPRRQLAKQDSTGDADIDAFVNEVKVLHRIRDLRAIDSSNKWVHVLPQDRDAAGIVCSSGRGSQRGAATLAHSARKAGQLINLVTTFQRRRDVLLMRWFRYWELCCGSMPKGPGFRILVNEEDIPVCSSVTFNIPGPSPVPVGFGLTV